MEDCIILRHQIERLVRQGLLDKYIARQRKSLNKDKDKRKKRRRTRSRGRQTPKTSDKEELVS